MSDAIPTPSANDNAAPPQRFNFARGGWGRDPDMVPAPDGEYVRFAAMPKLSAEARAAIDEALDLARDKSPTLAVRMIFSNAQREIEALP